MTTIPPGAGLSDFIAFAVIDELIRTILSRDEAADMFERVIANVRDKRLHVGERAIPILEEMRDEYRK